MGRIRERRRHPAGNGPDLCRDRYPSSSRRSGMSGRSNADESEKASDPASYEVGYGRPPQHSRFKPGQSGNIKGRPKGSKSLKAILEEALSSSVTITENGVLKKVALQELLFK